MAKNTTPQFDNPAGATPADAKPKKKGGCLKVLLGLVAFLVLISACQSLGKSDKATTAATTTAAAPTTTQAATTQATETQKATQAATTQAAETQAPETQAPETHKAEEKSSGLSAKQELAKAAAEQYLATMPFSKAGLIEQLSSDSGSQFAKADATAAVEALDVDWNEQAAKTAQNYLDTMPMSCSQLTEQLSSDSGSKFTAAQATYGAKQTKAC